MVIDETNSFITSCQCLDCAASAGGCKHAVAFLMWAHRRSEEPSCTEVECYWRKPTLSRVGTTLKYVTLNQLCKKTAVQHDTNPHLYNEFVQEAKKRKIDNCELLKYQSDFKYSDVRQFSLYHMFMQTSDELKNNVDQFIENLKQKLDQNALKLTEEATRSQFRNTMWYELRYARITASKVYEVSRCQTPDGSLVAAIFFAKTPDTPAIKRGRKLELAVIKTVQNKLNCKIKPCGLFVSQEYPMIAATPDGMTSDAVIEVKCPTSETTKCKYLNNGVVAEKYKAQVQLQMYVTNMKKGYFCVAHPDFEKTKKVDITILHSDNEYIRTLLTRVSSFWKQNIYPLLQRSAS
ncbi:hypothetical protein ACJJTC_019481 [Scirpophaga incertulas]